MEGLHTKTLLEFVSFSNRIFNGQSITNIVTEKDAT